MEIEDEMPISDARANLTEVVNTVRLQDRAIGLSRRGTAQAGIVPPDILKLIAEVGGVKEARAILTTHPKRFLRQEGSPDDRAEH